MYPWQRRINTSVLGLTRPRGRISPRRGSRRESRHTTVPLNRYRVTDTTGASVTARFQLHYVLTRTVSRPDSHHALSGTVCHSFFRSLRRVPSFHSIRFHSRVLFFPFLSFSQYRITALDISNSTTVSPLPRCARSRWKNSNVGCGYRVEPRSSISFFRATPRTRLRWYALFECVEFVGRQARLSYFFLDDHSNVDTRISFYSTYLQVPVRTCQLCTKVQCV